MNKLSLRSQIIITLILFAVILSSCQISRMNITPLNDYAHWHKKREYLGHPDEYRWDYNQVIFICQNAHDLIEYDDELTERVFGILRGPDELPEYTEKQKVIVVMKNQVPERWK